MKTIGQPLDFLGVNYYARHHFTDDPGQLWPATEPIAGPVAKASMCWEIYPQGLTDVLAELSRDYIGQTPVYIAENGVAADDRLIGGAVNDPERIDFIQRHLQAMKRAIDLGVNLKGFFYWSLLDNYEWALGYEKRFGLVHVDFDTLQRPPKASYHALAKALSG